ncbi:MAG: S1C family serine protease [Patescibacteria group bacterium]
MTRKTFFIIVGIVLWVLSVVLAGFIAAQVIQNKIPDVGGLIEDVRRVKTKGIDADTDAISFLRERAEGLVLPIMSDSVNDQAKSKQVGMAVALTSDGWTLVAKDVFLRFGSRIHLIPRPVTSSPLLKTVSDAETEFVFAKFDADELKVVSFGNADLEIGERIFVQTADGMFARRIAVADFRKNEKPFESSDDFERLWKLDLPIEDGLGAAVLSADGSLIGVMADEDVARPIEQFTSALGGVFKEGSARRPELGIRATNTIRVETANEGVSDGLIVRGVSAGLPAAKAGINVGDVILRIGNEPALIRSLAEFVARAKAGDELIFTVRRFNISTQTYTEETISVTL